MLLAVISKQQAFGKRKKMLASDALCCIAQFLDFASMCQLLFICKDWYKLNEQDAFWRCAFAAMIQQEILRLKTYKRQQSRCQKLQNLIDKHLGKKSTYRKKGISTRQLVQRHKQAQHIGKMLTKYSRVMRCKVYMHEEFVAKWDTLLFDLSHLLKLKHQRQHILIRFISDLERADMLGMRSNLFLKYYSQMRNTFGSTFSLAHDFYGPACLFSTHIAHLNDDIFLALFNDFEQDLQRRVGMLHEHILRSAAMVKPTLTKLKKIVESNVMFHPTLYKFKFNCPYYEALQTLFSLKAFSQADYILEQIIPYWDKYPEVHSKLLPLLLSYHPTSIHVFKVVELLPQPLESPDEEPVMSCLMQNIFNIPEHKLYNLLQKLIDKGFSLSAHKNDLRRSCLDTLLSKRLHSKQQAQILINVLCMIKPFVNFKGLHRGRPCFWLIRYYYEYELHLLEWLLKNGADPNMHNQKGECALLAIPPYADASVIKPAIELFFQHGLQLSSSDLDQCKKYFSNWKMLGL